MKPGFLQIGVLWLTASSSDNIWILSSFTQHSYLYWELTSFLFPQLPFLPKTCRAKAGFLSFSQEKWLKWQGGETASISQYLILTNTMVPPTQRRQVIVQSSSGQKRGSCGGSPGRFRSWSALGCWRGVSGGKDFSAGWTRSPSGRAWLPARQSALCGLLISGSRWHTCLFHS